MKYILAVVAISAVALTGCMKKTEADIQATTSVNGMMHDDMMKDDGGMMQADGDMMMHASGTDADMINDTELKSSAGELDAAGTADLDLDMKAMEKDL